MKKYKNHTWNVFINDFINLEVLVFTFNSYFILLFGNALSSIMNITM